MCARSLNVHGRTSSEPRSTLAKSQGRMPEDRTTGGGLLFGYFLLATQEKVTRSPQASGSFASDATKQRAQSEIRGAPGQEERGASAVPFGCRIDVPARLAGARVERAVEAFEHRREIL